MCSVRWREKIVWCLAWHPSNHRRWRDELMPSFGSSNLLTTFWRGPFRAWLLDTAPQLLGQLQLLSLLNPTALVSRKIRRAVTKFLRADSSARNTALMA